VQYLFSAARLGLRQDLARPNSLNFVPKFNEFGSIMYAVEFYLKNFFLVTLHMTNLTLAIIAPIAYGIGCISAGRIIARRAGVAVESQGSGSIGATNVARVVGKRAGLLTLLFDCLKAYLPCTVAYGFSHSLPFAAFVGFCILAGHCFSLPPAWKGGKGIAPGLGAYLALFPAISMLGLLTFAFVFYFSRIVSLSSLSATAMLLVCLTFQNPAPATLLAFLGMSAMVTWRHRENIERLVQGREGKFVSKAEKE
jgi:glycerol-3-phosphate acyltransferase PlsY